MLWIDKNANIFLNSNFIFSFTKMLQVKMLCQDINLIAAWCGRVINNWRISCNFNRIKAIAKTTRKLKIYKTTVVDRVAAEMLKANFEIIDECL